MVRAWCNMMRGKCKMMRDSMPVSWLRTRRIAEEIDRDLISPDLADGENAKNAKTSDPMEKCQQAISHGSNKS